jgi:hypothetical protein
MVVTPLADVVAVAAVGEFIVLGPFVVWFLLLVLSLDRRDRSIGDGVQFLLLLEEKLSLDRRDRSIGDGPY